MLRWLIRNRLNAAERRLGASLDYLRHLVDVSKMAFFKFSLVLPAAAHRRATPPEVFHAARIAALRCHDCGPCVQIAVNEARHAGVPATTIQAVLNDDRGALAEGVPLAIDFALAVVERSGEESDLRDRLRAKFSEAVVAELSLAIAMCGVFPTLKRGLGYATSCSRVQIEV